MFASRAARRAIHVRVRNVRNVRFASQDTQAAAPGGRGALTGGLAGGAVAFAVTYAWYHFSGAKSAVQTARTAKGYVDSAKNSLSIQFDEKAPDTNHVIKVFKDTAYKYAGFIPGGTAYVDSAFKDIDAIRQKHGDDVDRIVREAYDELREASKNGFSLETVTATWTILTKHLERLGSLAGDAGEDILNNHPELKQKLGGSTEQLKEFGKRLGPEAKRLVDDTRKEVDDLVKNGMQADTVTKAWSLIQEKLKQLKRMQEKAFSQGYEQLKPMLEKNPKIKKVVEDNMDTLKQGDVAEAVRKVQSAISSGDTKELEDFFKQAKGKAEQAAPSGLTDWLHSVPAGGEIISRLQKLQEVAQKKSPEAESIAKETFEELKKVLDSKSEKIEKLYKEGKSEAQN